MMSIDMLKIVDNFAQALESARKTRSKKLICDCDQALHWKKRAKELAKIILKFRSDCDTNDWAYLCNDIATDAEEILKEIESEEEPNV